MCFSGKTTKKFRSFEGRNFFTKKNHVKYCLHIRPTVRKITKAQELILHTYM